MLEVINNLSPFFEDCYRRISVRVYSRLVKLSPPTSSKLLRSYNKEGLLSMTKDRNYLFFHANKGSKEFILLSRIYWHSKLSEFTLFLEKEMLSPTIVLFGSLSKAEAIPDSDIDLAVFAPKKDLNVKEFEKKLKRKIQLFMFKSIKDIENRELANSIINGHILTGGLKL